MGVPICVHFDTFPAIGRELTQNDLGKKIVRTRPHGKECGYLPCKDSKPDYSSVILLSLNSDSIEIRSDYGVYKLDRSWMDRNWLSLDEYLVKTQNLAAVIYTHVDMDPPY